MSDFINNFALGQDYINGLVLTGLIIINIFLGSLDAIINNQFDKIKFFKGIKKGFAISLATFLTYILGGLIPNVLVINVNNVDVNITTAIGLTITAGLIWYGKEVLVKIKTAILGSAEVK